MADLNRRHQALYDYIVQNPGLTAKDIARYFESHLDETLEATDNATRCALRRLVQKGLIEYRTTKLDRQFPKYYAVK